MHSELPHTLVDRYAPTTGVFFELSKLSQLSPSLEYLSRSIIGCRLGSEIGGLGSPKICIRGFHGGLPLSDLTTAQFSHARIANGRLARDAQRLFDSRGSKCRDRHPNHRLPLHRSVARAVDRRATFSGRHDRQTKRQKF
jgi:hypothetical protein